MYIFPATAHQILVPCPTGAALMHEQGHSWMARTSSENSCVPFKNWLAGPARADKWKETLERKEPHEFFSR